jgi:hypothetical protein
MCDYSLTGLRNRLAEEGEHLVFHRRLDKSMQLLEFKCVEFVEELIYGHLARSRGSEKGGLR